MTKFLTSFVPCAEAKLTKAEVMSIVLPLAARWKELGTSLGCGEDLLDEIFTNNETDEHCLRNLVDVYKERITAFSLASALGEMGETELLASQCKQGDNIVIALCMWYDECCVLYFS